MRARVRAINTQRAHDRWCVWHTMAPHVKKMPPLDKFVDAPKAGQKAAPKQMTPAQIEAVFTRWRFVQAGNEAVAKKQKQARPKHAPRLKSKPETRGATHG